jgi:hypothetical protein
LHRSLPFLLHLPSLLLFAAFCVVHHDTTFAYNGAPRALAAPALFICPGFLHAFVCLYAALRYTADFGAFCTQVGLRGGVYRVHKHARHGGVRWRARGQAAHPAGSYKYSHLIQRFSVRASTNDINFVADIHITVRHDGLVSGLVSLSESNTRFHPR